MALDYYIGAHLVGVTIQGMTRVSGVLTASGSPIDITAYVDLVQMGASNLPAQIFPVNAGKVHNEPTLLDSSFSLAEIKRAVGGTKLRNLSFGFTFCRVIATEVNGDRYTMVGMVGSLRDGTTAVGKNTANIDILQTGDGGLSFTPGS